VDHRTDVGFTYQQFAVYGITAVSQMNINNLLAAAGNEYAIIKYLKKQYHRSRRA